MPEYFDRYINMNDDVPVLEALEISLRELETLPIDQWREIGNAVYAPGKWTIRSILQHLIDTERVFAYRALSFARGEKNVMPFDEELYGRNAKADNRLLEDLIEEAIQLRKSTIHLYKSFDQEMLAGIGISFRGEYAVNAIGYIFSGHQRWHFRIIEEKYLPLQVVKYIH